MAEYKIEVETTGSAGSATGEGQTDGPVRGFVYAVRLDYDGSAPATTSVVLEELEGLVQSLLTINTANSDVVKFPRGAEVSNVNSALGTYAPFYVDGHRLKLSVSDCDALTMAVTATVQVIEG